MTTPSIIGITTPETARHLSNRLIQERRENYMYSMQLILERDLAEEAVSKAYEIVTGKVPQWSVEFGHREALEEIRETMKALTQTVVVNEKPHTIYSDC